MTGPLSFQHWRSGLVSAGGYFKQPGNGSRWLTWCCHSPCLRPPSPRCQGPEDCRGYPQSVCRPLWNTQRKTKTTWSRCDEESCIRRKSLCEAVQEKYVKTDWELWIQTEQIQLEYHNNCGVSKLNCKRKLEKTAMWNILKNLMETGMDSKIKSLMQTKKD